MTRDIETREDIDALMRAFYAKALADEEIGYIFTDVARLDLDAHLPIIGDFWESLLLGRDTYRRHGRNPLQIHGQLNLRTPLENRHFGRWLEIFEATVDEMFAGPRADFAKTRAASVANRMKNFIRRVPDLELTRRETFADPADRRE
ncbi:MAG: group III truncated hemoglobin [Pyrinomonadaceae bacterium]